MTKLELCHREYGVHSPIKEINLPNPVDYYYNFEDEKVNEQELINDIPKGWLPTSPNRILLCVRDSEYGGTGCRGLAIFKDFSKYFSCYSLTIDLWDSCGS